MSALANITVFDGAATPVTHTLIGESVSRDPDGSIVAVYKESNAAVPDYAQIRCTLRKKRLPTGVFRVSARAEVPVMESVTNANSSGYTAAPKVAYTDTVEVIGYFHERSLVTGRRLVRQLAINVAGSVSTSVAPVTTGPVPELIDQLLMPT
jgi:hypothetical protein